MMVMSAQHQVHSGRVEDGQEDGGHVVVAVPGVLGVRGDVAEDYPSLSLFPGIAGYYPFHPFCFLEQIGFGAVGILILDVAVRLILPAVHHQEEDITVSKCVVRFPFREGIVVKDLDRIFPAELMVPPGEIERAIGGERL